MSVEAIVMAIITAVVIPFFAPMLMDALATFYIACRNKAKGKPTWKIGTQFYDVILPNAASIGDCFIIGVTFDMVVLKRVSKPGIVRMKKRKMLKCDCIEADVTIRK